MAITHDVWHPGGGWTKEIDYRPSSPSTTTSAQQTDGREQQVRTPAKRVAGDGGRSLRPQTRDSFATPSQADTRPAYPRPE